MMTSETVWVLHESGHVRWITAECPICRNGVQIDFVASEILQRVTFNHCGTHERIPDSILGGTPAREPGRVRVI